MATLKAHGLAHEADHDAPAPATPVRPAPGTAHPVEPLLYRTGDLVKVLRTSIATLHRMQAAGKLPRPIRWGGRLCWRVAEVKAWVAAGMPDRKTWELTHPAR